MSNTISNIQRSSAAYKIDAEQKSKKSEEAQGNQAVKKTDSVVISGSMETPVTYTKAGNKLGVEDVREIKGQQQQNLEHLKNLVRKLILEQKKNAGAGGAADDLDISGILEADDIAAPAGLEGAEGTDAAAAASGTGAAMADDWSAEAVSDRIVDFAISISGGDKSKLDSLIAAIDKGFEQASQAFGKELPDICNQTHDLIMEKLDKWSKEE